MGFKTGLLIGFAAGVLFTWLYALLISSVDKSESQEKKMLKPVDEREIFNENKGARLKRFIGPSIVIFFLIFLTSCATRPAWQANTGCKGRDAMVGTK